MTAERLEYLLIRLHGTSGSITINVEDAVLLARRVIAAEKLVEALDRSLNKSVTVEDMAELDTLITAYREASK